MNNYSNKCLTLDPRKINFKSMTKCLIFIKSEFMRLHKWENKYIVPFEIVLDSIVDTVLISVFPFKMWFFILGEHLLFRFLICHFYTKHLSSILEKVVVNWKKQDA